jgi:hypothetical protein
MPAGTEQRRDDNHHYPPRACTTAGGCGRGEVSVPVGSPRYARGRRCRTNSASRWSPDDDRPPRAARECGTTARPDRRTGGTWTAAGTPYLQTTRRCRRTRCCQEPTLYGKAGRGDGFVLLDRPRGCGDLAASDDLPAGLGRVRVSSFSIPSTARAGCGNGLIFRHGRYQKPPQGRSPVGPVAAWCRPCLYRINPLRVRPRPRCSRGVRGFRLSGP